MWKFLFRENAAGVRPTEPMEVTRTDLKALDANQELLVWFGHSSYLVQTAGRRILVDPVFCRAAPVSFVNRPFAATDAYAPEDMPRIDYLVITHDHWDHLDYETVVRLRERVGRVVCPLGVGEHFEYWGFEPERIVELDWDEEAMTEEEFRVVCLPTRHFSGRGLRRNRTLWASFLIDSPTQRIYIGGDGGYDDRFADIGRRFPGITLAMLENGQYNEAWRYIHTMPEYLGRAARELGAERIVTVHHSKYALARHAWDEPLEHARRLAERMHLRYAEAIEKVQDSVCQKELNTSFRQHQNAEASFKVNQVLEENVLLVDDMVDSGWTLTVCGFRLMEKGCQEVYPFALADSGQSEDD